MTNCNSHEYPLTTYRSGYPVTGNFLNISLRKSMREELERLGRQMEEAEVFNSAEADEDEA